MELIKIIKKYNVTTTLILPLFNNLLYEFHNQKIVFSGLLLDNGLVNCYLYDNRILKFSPYRETNKLLLVFKKDLFFKNISNLEIKKSSFSVSELIITNPYFLNLEVEGNLVYVNMHIDGKWNKDIVNITKSKYSKVSDEYKKQILLEGIVLTPESELSKFYVLKNIAAKIVFKSESLKKTLSDVLEIEIDNDIDLWEKFDIKKETFYR